MDNETKPNSIFNPDPKDIKHNVSILHNEKETTFCSRFEIVTKEKEKEDAPEEKWFYTEHYRENKKMPGIPESIPISFSLADSTGNPVYVKLQDPKDRDLLLAIQKAVIDYETVTEEDLKEGAKKIEAIDASINVE